MMRCGKCGKILEVNTETEWKTDDDPRPKYAAYCPNCNKSGVVLVEDYKLEILMRKILEQEANNK